MERILSSFLPFYLGPSALLPGTAFPFTLPQSPASLISGDHSFSGGCPSILDHPPQLGAHLLGSHFLYVNLGWGSHSELSMLFMSLPGLHLPHCISLWAPSQSSSITFWTISSVHLLYSGTWNSADHLPRSSSKFTSPEFSLPRHHHFISESMVVVNSFSQTFWAPMGAEVAPIFLAISQEPGTVLGT